MTPSQPWTSTLPDLVDRVGGVDVDPHVDLDRGSGVRILDQLELDAPWFDASGEPGDAA